MNFAKKDTLTMKGIAILFLYCYHCFSNKSRWGGTIVSFFPFSQKVGIYVTESMNICVGMFVFLSVYGMTILMKKKYSSFEMPVLERGTFALKRYIGLLADFMIPFLVCQIVTKLMGRHHAYGEGLVANICNFVLDMVGLSQFFDTPMLVGTWWYVSFAVLLIFIMPIFIEFYRKYRLLIIPVWAFVLLLGVKEINNMNRWLFSIPLGICFADGDWFFRFYQWKYEDKLIFWMKRILVLILFLGLVFLRKHTWGQHLPLLINSILPVIMIYLWYDILHDCERIKKFLVFLGKHSGNMFYIHTFVRWIWLKELTYSFYHAGLILIFLIVITLLMSAAIEKVKEIIHYQAGVEWVQRKIVNFVRDISQNKCIMG